MGQARGNWETRVQTVTQDGGQGRIERKQSVRDVYLGKQVQRRLPSWDLSFAVIPLAG